MTDLRRFWPPWLDDAVRAEVQAAYAGRVGGYHDLRHLTEVLGHLAELGCAAAEVVLAAWFHDAVYRGRPGEDEHASGLLAVEVLGTLGVAPGTAGRVRDLVVVTAGHDPAPDDDDAAALCDADLAILAAPALRYRAYVAGVRHEYRHLDDATFRAGRSAVLRGLAARPQVYRTPAARGRWEAAARDNLSTELARLGEGSDSCPQA